MTTAAPTVRQIEASLREYLRKGLGDAEAFAFRATPRWTGPATITVERREYRIVPCVSSLAVREALTTRPGDTSGLVVLTDRTDDDLGADVRARIAKNRVLPLDVWHAVMEVFRAREIDPALVDEKWMPAVLLEGMPPDGFPPVPAGVLDAETAWRHVLKDRVQLAAEAPTVAAVLAWTSDGANLERWLAESPDVRSACRRWIELRAGGARDTIDAIFRCVDSRHGAKAVAVGLVLRVLFGDGRRTDALMAGAAARIEPFVGDAPLTDAAALRWADAAEEIVGGAMERGEAQSVRVWQESAEAILDRVMAAEHAQFSDFLPRGLGQRLDRFGTTLRDALRDESTVASPVVENAASRVLAHREMRARPAIASTVTMAMRLVRWVATSPASRTATSLDLAASAYLREGSFVDWARSSAWDDGHSSALRDAFTALRERVATIREEENRRFATTLAAWSEVLPSRGALLPIERVLDETIVPIAATETPVLLLVLDGMAASVFRELVEDLRRAGWADLLADDRARRGPVIAALPTVTEVSRASLLCGNLVRGPAAAEQDGFSSHIALRAVSTPKRPPVLFHKEGLGDGGVGLAAAVRDAISDPSQRVVGVVLNTVDDWLLKGDQYRPTWSATNVVHLTAILEACRSSDPARVVVLTADHGHVIERGSSYRPGVAGERWREGADSFEEDEVRVRGPRVLLGGGDVILPASERVRYGGKKNGYHGGATPQEVVVPLAVLTSGDPPTGWSDAPVETPAWWTRVEAAAPIADRPVVARPVPTPPVQRPLFEGIDVGPKAAAKPHTPTPTVGSSWIDALLASPVFQEQRERNARVAPDETRIRAFLAALAERGGVMNREALSARLSVADVRLGGMVAAMRRILNVEGYAVLEIDEHSGTVILNVELLRMQFNIAARVPPLGRGASA